MDHQKIRQAMRSISNKLHIVERWFVLMHVPLPINMQRKVYERYERQACQGHEHSKRVLEMHRQYTDLRASHDRFEEMLRNE